MPLVIIDVYAMELDDASVAIVDDILSWWIDYLKCHVVVAIVENLEVQSLFSLNPELKTQKRFLMTKCAQLNGHGIRVFSVSMVAWTER